MAVLERQIVIFILGQNLQRLEIFQFLFSLRKIFFQFLKTSLFRFLNTFEFLFLFFFLRLLFRSFQFASKFRFDGFSFVLVFRSNLLDRLQTKTFVYVSDDKRREVNDFLERLNRHVENRSYA